MSLAPLVPGLPAPVAGDGPPSGPPPPADPAAGFLAALAVALGAPVVSPGDRGQTTPPPAPCIADEPGTVTTAEPTPPAARGTQEPELAVPADEDRAPSPAATVVPQLTPWEGGPWAPVLRASVAPPGVATSDQRTAIPRVPGPAPLVASVGSADTVVPGAGPAPGTTITTGPDVAAARAPQPAGSPSPEPAARTAPVVAPAAAQVAAQVAAPPRELAPRPSIPAGTSTDRPTIPSAPEPAPAPAAADPTPTAVAPVTTGAPDPHRATVVPEGGPRDVPPPSAPSVSPVSVSPVAVTAPTAGVPTMTAPAPDPRPVSTAAVVDQVAPGIARLARAGNGSHRFTITLQPQHLGDVRVTVLVRDGVVRVNLASDQAKDVLAQAAPELRRLLEQSGATDARVVVRELVSSGTDAASSDAAHSDAADARQREHGSGHREESTSRHSGAARDRRSEGGHHPRLDPPPPPTRAATNTDPTNPAGRLDRLM